jgi:hypothetical protein
VKGFLNSSLRYTYLEPKIVAVREVCRPRPRDVGECNGSSRGVYRPWPKIKEKPARDLTLARIA